MGAFLWFCAADDVSHPILAKYNQGTFAALYTLGEQTPSRRSCLIALRAILMKSYDIADLLLHHHTEAPIHWKKTKGTRALVHEEYATAAQ